LAEPHEQHSSAIWPTSGESFDVGRDDVYLNRKISKFFETDDLFFLVAAKGMGKTILLKRKRQQIQSRSPVGSESGGRLILPANSELDYITMPPSLSQNWLSELRDVRSWSRLWQFAIVISVFLNFPNRQMDSPNLAWMTDVAKSRGIDPYLAEKLLAKCRSDKTFSDAPSHVLSALLSMDLSNYKSLEATLFQHLTRFYVDHFRHSVVIFIDSFDQSLSDVGVATGDFGVWTNGQIGLIKACWQVNRQNPHIRVYTSMRQEAYSRFQDEDRLAIEGSVAHINYERSDLKDLFDTLVRNYENAKSFEDFCGFKAVRNLRTQNQERAFDYVYRHIIGKPRELALIGKSIHEEGLPTVKDSVAREDRLRTIVNNVASTEIRKAYLAGEMPRFLESLSSDKHRNFFFETVPFNILTPEEIKRVTRRFSAHVQPPTGVTARPFEELYNLGLLGLLEERPTDGVVRQRFKRPHEYEASVRELPKSPYYFLHASLEVCRPRSLVANGDVGGMVVGDETPWLDQHERMIHTNEIKLFISYSWQDRTWVDNFEADLCDTFDRLHIRVSIWRDVWRMRAGALVQEQVSDAIKGSDALIVVLSDHSVRSGFVNQEWQAMSRREIKGGASEGLVIPVAKEHIDKDKLSTFLAIRHVALLLRRPRAVYRERLSRLTQDIAGEIAKTRRKTSS
jgi:TIR domain